MNNGRRRHLLRKRWCALALAFSYCIVTIYGLWHIAGLYDKAHYAMHHTKSVEQASCGFAVFTGNACPDIGEHYSVWTILHHAIFFSIFLCGVWLFFYEWITAHRKRFVLLCKWEARTAPPPLWQRLCACGVMHARIP